MTSPRLYLYTPCVGADAADVARALPEALAAADIAAVLLRLHDADERTLINRIKTITAAAQGADAALLLDGRPALAARAGADGAHLAGIEALTAALPSLKPERIAGAGDLRSRHDAMLAAEAGADYVMFGEPAAARSRPARAPGEGDRQPPFAAVLERVSWWAQLFESPCVGYAENLDEVMALARAQADFVALGEWIWTNAHGPAAAIEEVAAQLASARRG